MPQDLPPETSRPDITPDSAPALPARKSLFFNYASLLGGSVFAKALSLVTVLVLARYLGVVDFGLYSLVFSYWGLLNTLVDVGVSHILGREIAKAPHQPRPPLETAIYLRLLGCALFLPLGALLAPQFGLSSSLTLLIAIGILVGFEAFYDVYFSATMQLHHNAKARSLSSLLQVFLIGLAVWMKAPLLVILWISLLSPLFKLIFDIRYGGRFRPTLHAPNWKALRGMARDSWPLWLAGLQYLILTRIDTLMLQVLSPTGEHDLGIYSAAFRISEALALIINALCPALLPLLVAHLQQPERLRFIAGTGMRVILSALILLSLLIFWYAPWIVKLYGPGYEEATACMRILIGSQALVAVNALCYHLLLIHNAQGRRPVILNGTLMMALNIGLNLWWIPLFKAEGASWATLMTEIAMTCSMLWFLRRYTPLRLSKDFLILEGMALLSSLPLFWLGDAYGILSAGLFLSLVFGFRLLTPASLRRLAREKLPASPMSPT